MKWKNTLCAVLCILLCACLLGGCHDRTGDVAQADRGDFDPELERETPSLPPEEEERPDPEEDLEFIDDPEQVDEAKKIVLDLLDRAEVCEDIYQARLKSDRNGTAVPGPEGGEYLPVERFETMDELQAWLGNTFVMSGETVARMVSDIQDAKLFVSINGELYQTTEERMTPMTLGEWDLSYFRLLEMDGEHIVVRMSTKIAGSDNGYQNLNIVKSGGEWLLDDSYFLD